MQLLVYLYLLAIIWLCFYGLHRAWLLSCMKDSVDPPTPEMKVFPQVCVQLPFYNEQAVAKRVIEAVSRFDYPRDRLSIQLLDDSDDETVEIVDSCAEQLKLAGVQVEILRRSKRHGFKAGALAAGLKRTQAECIAIFDADFIPEPDFLKKTIPQFSSSEVGFVQTRWSFINRGTNWFTRAQAVLLDGHFVIEHAARFVSGLFFNFNGTAGVWRRVVIEEVGGWQANTITEDLDLSYRAQLAGWRGVYLRDYCCSSELPETIQGFKTQQYRWSKGMTQVFRKLAPVVITSEIPLRQKLEAVCHLSSSFGYIAGFVIAILLAPVCVYRSGVYQTLGPWVELLVFFFTLGSLSFFYWCSQNPNWKRDEESRASLQDIILAVVLGIGITANCTKAVLSGLFFSEGEFVRTPKTGSEGRVKKYKFSQSQLLSTFFKAHRKEMLMTLYLLLGLFYLYLESSIMSMPFVMLILLGYLSVCLLHFSVDGSYE